MKRMRPQFRSRIPFGEDQAAGSGRSCRATRRRNPRGCLLIRFKYVRSNLGFGRQNRTATSASTCLAFEQLILNQLLGHGGWQVQVVMEGKRETYLFPALIHEIWRLYSITACCYCFAAAVASIFPRVPRFPDPHSQIAKARTIKSGWEFNRVLREESNMQEGSAIREHRKLGPDV